MLTNHANYQSALLLESHFLRYYNSKVSIFFLSTPQCSLIVNLEDGKKGKVLCKYQASSQGHPTKHGKATHEAILVNSRTMPNQTEPSKPNLPTLPTNFWLNHLTRIPGQIISWVLKTGGHKKYPRFH